MQVELRRPYVELKPEYQELYDQFIEYEHYGCYCHSCPPCGWCTDAGNPQNLNETDESWVEKDKMVVEYGDRLVEK